MSEAERQARAARYVSGTMEAHERERAERDLVLDPEFRDAVLRRSEDLRRNEKRAADPDGERRWQELAARLGQPRPLDGRTSAPPAPVSAPAPPVAGSRLLALLLAVVAAAFLVGFFAGRISMAPF